MNFIYFDILCFAFIDHGHNQDEFYQHECLHNQIRCIKRHTFCTHTHLCAFYVHMSVFDEEFFLKTVATHVHSTSRFYMWDGGNIIIDSPKSQIMEEALLVSFRMCLGSV
jgi:hypothetical protein